MDDKYMELVSNANKEAYLLYKNGTLGRKPWSSHQPVLIHLLNTIMEGDVLEFGVGHHSTPIMHTICAAQKRKLLSIDSSSVWLNKFFAYASPSHEMFVSETQKILNEEYDFFKRKFAIAFVDADLKIRQPFIVSMSHRADYVIVHDTEVLDANPYEWDYKFSAFKHVLHFPNVLPRTTLLSNLDEINKDILTIF